LLYKLAVGLNIAIAVLWLALPIWSFFVFGHSWRTIFYCFWPLCLLLGSVLARRKESGFVAATLCFAGSFVLCTLVIRDVVQADIDFFGTHALGVVIGAISAAASLYISINMTKRTNEGIIR
jgi:hypothetical protein